MGFVRSKNDILDGFLNKSLEFSINKNASVNKSIRISVMKLSKHDGLNVYLVIVEF